MERIITPIIHAAFLIPLLAISMGSIELIAVTFDLVPDYISVFRVPYIFLITIIIIIFGIPIFWLANRAIRAIEKDKNRTILDHIRQSFFFYLLILYVLITWIFSGFKGDVDDVYFLTGLMISIISIVLNYNFLFRGNKSNL